MTHVESEARKLYESQRESLFARTLLQFYWCQVGERDSCPESAPEKGCIPGTRTTVRGYSTIS